MKKVNVSFSATIEKTIEIPDDLYDEYRYRRYDDESGLMFNSPYWKLVSEFEKQSVIDVDVSINQLNSVEDAETGEYIFEN